ncbi:MAG: response regulator [Acidobacteria bacterium]|nr:response regulator [Acidobacteriota bacterium]
MPQTPAPKTILVVDDDPDTHDLLRALAASPDWRIDDAYSGAEALSRLESASYDLVLTDVRMPGGIDGLELARRIQELRPGSKVVVMTAESTPVTLIQSLRDGAFSYFSKPFDGSAVLEMINQALETTGGSDDIEVLSARPQWIAVNVRCVPGIADRLVQFLRELKMDLPAHDRENVAQALREILMNAIEHGGHFDPNQRVYLAYVRTSRMILYHLRDPGKGFSFNDLPHAAVSNPPGSPTGHVEYRLERGLRPGGFGILLVRELVDELIYSEKGNEVLLMKYLPEPGATG